MWNVLHWAFYELQKPPTRLCCKILQCVFFSILVTKFFLVKYKVCSCILFTLRFEKSTTTKTKKQGLVNFLTDKAPTPTHRGQVTTATAHLMMEMTLKNRVTSGSARREVEHEDLIRVKLSWLQMKHCHSVTFWVCLPPLAESRNKPVIRTSVWSLNSPSFFVQKVRKIWGVYPDHRRWKKEPDFYYSAVKTSVAPKIKRKQDDVWSQGGAISLSDACIVRK